MKRLLATALGLAAALICWRAGADEQQPAQVVALPTPAVLGSSARVEQALKSFATSTEPRAVRTIPAGSDLSAMLRTEYGDAAPAMWNIVRSANDFTAESRDLLKATTLPTQLLATQQIDEFIVPEGPKWVLKPTTVVATRGETSASLAQKYMGATGPLLARAQELIRILNPTVNFASLEPGQPVRIPEMAVPVIATSAGSIDLRSARDLNVYGKPDAMRPSKSLASADARCPATPPNWNDHWKAVMALYQDVEEKFRKSGRSVRNDVRVAVLDSGVHPEEASSRDRIEFWRGGQTNTVGYDTSEAKDGVVTELPWARFATPWIVNHGTHVAGLIQGGDIDATLRSRLRKNVQVMVFKVVRRDGAARAGQDDGEISAEAIGAALEKVGTAAIINLSVESQNTLAPTWKAMLAKEGVLFVIAAGNGAYGSEVRIGQNLGGKRWMPGSLGGLSNPRVITVGAHDRGAKHTKMPFTNFGMNEVTLSAPGCDLPSFLADGKSGEYSGTSQAAPVVSLVASMLMHLGLDPVETKQRIMAGVDWDSVNGNLFVSGGALNEFKTLNIMDDVLDEDAADGALVLGEIRSPDCLDSNRAYAVQLAGNDGQPYAMSLANILKITVVGVNDKSGAITARIFGFPEEGLPEPLYREGELRTVLKFQPTGGAARPIKMAVGTDLVLSRLDKVRNASPLPNSCNLIR